MKQFGMIFLMLLGLALVRCSVVDGGDRAELEARIDKLDAVDRAAMVGWASRQREMDWLRKQNQDEVVGRASCLSKDSYDPAKREWTDGLPITIEMIAQCIEAGLGDYRSCLSGIAESLLDMHEKAGQKCTFEVLEAWTPSKVERQSGSARVFINTSAIADALIGSPKPPPFPWFDPNKILILESLCAMSAGGWGCPDSPDYPIPTAPAEPGDHQ
jgi:hypothetical protein